MSNSDDTEGPRMAGDDADDSQALTGGEITKCRAPLSHESAPLDVPTPSERIVPEVIPSNVGSHPNGFPFRTQTMKFSLVLTKTSCPYEMDTLLGEFPIQLLDEYGIEVSIPSVANPTYTSYVVKFRETKRLDQEEVNLTKKEKEARATRKLNSPQRASLYTQRTIPTK